MTFKVIPIDDAVVDEVRASMVSPQYKAFPAFRAVATGYGPCRSCLNTFDEGNEDRTSFTYNPFASPRLPLPGPVFVHSEQCEPFRGDGFPPGIRHLPMVLDAYSAEQIVVSRTSVEADKVETQIQQILQDERVEMIYIRNVEVGCFIAMIHRA